ncbi:MAG TPA: substrate-binding domain-containing protein [Terriglobales bacterium]|jgi:ABC-type sugar transport system substrate-binding protein|nr:substrate-binding domain-containing protein [Terriglobales bacterium]
MKRLRIVVSLITQDNDYQVEQAAAAEEAARRLAVDVEILYADADSIQQSQQILKFVQAAPEARPDGIIFEPVGGLALPQVGRAAVSSGMGWVVLNREVEYVKQLRTAFKVPVFIVAVDNLEAGRIQGRQMGALLPSGGSALYIQGPSDADASKLRTAGMYETKPANIQVKTMKGNWTEASAFKAVTSWLRLSTSQQSHIDIIVAQNDAMAAGAKKALQQFSYEAEGRDHWVNLPFLGVDGVPKTGQAWVRSSVLAATVVCPPLAGTAMDLLTRALQTKAMPQETTLVTPHSFPEIAALKGVKSSGHASGAH